MKRKKYYSSIMICILICVGVLSACANGKQVENPYGSSNSSQQQAAGARNIRVVRLISVNFMESLEIFSRSMTILTL